MSRKSLLNETSEFYLKSGDYNGMPVSLLVERYGEMNVRDWLSELISEGLISVVFGDYHPNPHIKALPSEPESEQLGKLNTRLFQRACVYPNGKHLSEVIDHAAFAGRPFDFCLALGEPQLIHKSFDLSILEAYRNDPRYYYTCDDIHGQISVVDEFSRTDTMKASDQVFLETFGFSFDEAGHLHVAAFLRYLSKLSPEHQQVWSSKHVSGETYLHPDYYRTSIIGDWPERLSLYQAVLLEMKTVNEICVAIGREPLFRDDYAESRRPRAFGYLLRPTLKEYNEFIHLLDKMLSENITREFFRDDVSFESEEQRSDSKTVVRPKGKIQILADWLRSEFRTGDCAPIEEMLETLRHVRKLRQRPAHAIKEDEFNPEYLHEQRQLMKRVYHATKNLRSVLRLHPLASGVRICERLEACRIWWL